MLQICFSSPPPLARLESGKPFATAHYQTLDI